MTVTSNTISVKRNYNTSLSKVNSSSFNERSAQSKETSANCNTEYEEYNYDQSTEESAVQLSANATVQAAPSEEEEEDKSIWATAGNVFFSIGEGIASFGESVVDGLATVGSVIDGGVADLLGDHEYADRLRNETKAFVSEEHVKSLFDEIYETTSIGKEIKEKSYGYATTRQIGNGIGYTVGVVVACVLTAGVGSALSGGTIAVEVTSGGMAAWGGLAGVGKGSQEAWSNGADYWTGVEYGAATGAWEATQFYVGGQINKFSNAEFTTAQNIASRILMDTADGAAEGFVQPFLQSIYREGYTDPETGQYVKFDENDGVVDRFLGMWIEQGGWQGVATNAAIAAGMSSLGEFGEFKFRKNKGVVDLDNINKKVGKNIELSTAEKEVIENARKSLGLGETATVDEITKEANRIFKSVDFDKINTKNMDLSTLKKMSDSIDGLDTKAQKEILSVMTGAKKFDSISMNNRSQYSKSMDSFICSLTNDNLKQMDKSVKKIIEEHMLLKLGDASNYSSIEEMHVAFVNEINNSNMVSSYLDSYFDDILDTVDDNLYDYNPPKLDNNRAPKVIESESPKVIESESPKIIEKENMGKKVEIVSDNIKTSGKNNYINVQGNKLKAQELAKSALDPNEVYSIGTHLAGLSDGIASKSEFADSVLDNGLILKGHEGGGLTTTVHMKGSTNYEMKLDDIVADFYQGVDNDVYKGGVIVAVPASIKGKDGKKYFLGVYPDNLSFVSKDVNEIQSLPIEALVSKTENVPKELILGTIVKVDDNVTFVENPNFISRLSEDMQADWLDKYIKEGLETGAIDDLKNSVKHELSFLEAFSGSDSDLYESKKGLYDSILKYEKDSSIKKVNVDNSKKNILQSSSNDLSSADKSVVENINNKSKQVIKSVDSDSISINDIDSSTLKKLNDSVTGLDSTAQEEIISVMIGAKDLQSMSLENMGQFSKSMDSFICSLTDDNFKQMNDSIKKMVKEHMELRLDDSLSYGSLEEMHSAFVNKINSQKINASYLDSYFDDMFDTMDDEIDNIKAIDNKTSNVDSIAIKEQEIINNSDNTTQNLKKFHSLYGKNLINLSDEEIAERAAKIFGIDLDSNPNAVIKSVKQCQDYYESLNRGVGYLKNIPSDQKTATKLYTSYLFNKINNGLLRKFNGDFLNNEIILSDNGIHYNSTDVINSLDNLIHNSPLENDMIFFRGTNIDQFSNLGISSLDELNACVGKKVVMNDCGYMSSTAVMGKGYTKSEDVVLVMRVPEGNHAVYVDPISTYSGSGELEVILPRNSSGIISGTEQINGKTFVYLDMLPEAS